MSSRRLAAAGVALGLAVAVMPQAALAYDAAEGIEDFLVGLMQPLFSPAPLLALRHRGQTLAARRSADTSQRLDHAAPRRIPPLVQQLAPHPQLAAESTHVLPVAIRASAANFNARS